MSRVALHSAFSSTFMKLFNSCSDQALKILTGLAHRTFRCLLVGFTSPCFMFTQYSQETYITQLSKTQRRRPQRLSLIALLALALTRYCTRRSCTTLRMLLSIIMTVCNMFLGCSRRILHHALSCDSLSKVMDLTLE